jgi:hypothetical protein
MTIKLLRMLAADAGAARPGGHQTDNEPSARRARSWNWACERRTLDSRNHGLAQIHHEFNWFAKSPFEKFSQDSFENKFSAKFPQVPQIIDTALQALEIPQLEQAVMPQLFKRTDAPQPLDIARPQDQWVQDIKDSLVEQMKPFGTPVLSRCLELLEPMRESLKLEAEDVLAIMEDEENPASVGEIKKRALNERVSEESKAYMSRTLYSRRY